MTRTRLSMRAATLMLVIAMLGLGAAVVNAGNASCWQGDDRVCLYQLPDTITIIRAPDEATINKIVDSLRLLTQDA